MSRSKSRTISARRMGHAAAIVTFLPFLRSNASGSVGYGLAVASSYVAGLVPDAPAGIDAMCSIAIADERHHHEGRRPSAVDSADGVHRRGVGGTADGDSSISLARGQAYQ